VIIFDIPGKGGRGGLRVGSLGSCRIRNPLTPLANRDDLRSTAGGLEATHTAAEALQTLEFILGERVIPAQFNRYIFNKDETPAIDRLQMALHNKIDVFLLEVADFQQFSSDGVLLQQSFVGTKLVGAYGSALLPWFRQVCRNGQSDEATVTKAIEQLAAKGYEPDAALEALLRSMKLSRHSTEDVKRDLSAMMAKMGGRWVVVGPLVVPGVDSDIMSDRRELVEQLKVATLACGAAFYDPSALIEQYGRSRVLDDNGANIYEWAEEFYPTVGETLVRLANDQIGGDDNLTRALRAAPGSASSEESPASRSALADRLNQELLAVHGRRVEELGVDGSGRYPHYRAILDQNAIISTRERRAFELISAYVPSYAVYAVLRAGLGELALLLAASGRRVIAFEAQPNRCAALRAGAGHLVAAGLMEESALTLVAGQVPTAPLPSGALGVALGAVFGRDPATSAALMPKMSAFEGLLINLRAILRESPAERALAAEELAALGFARVRDYPTAGQLTWFHRRALRGVEYSEPFLPGQGAAEDRAEVIVARTPVQS